MDLRPVWEYMAMIGLEPSEPARAELETFLDALYEANSHTNLTRVAKEDAPIRHVVDSLMVVPFIPEGVSVLDIGSGPGIPSWVIAWARPDLTVVALDSTAKMQRFVADHLRPNLTQRIKRAEEDIFRERFDFATGRAVAPLGIQAELSAAWLKVGGMFVPFRTASERELIESANVGMLGLKLRDLHQIPVPDGSGDRLFPVYEKVKPTPMEYPRTWAKIRNRPLGISKSGTGTEP